MDCATLNRAISDAAEAAKVSLEIDQGCRQDVHSAELEEIQLDVHDGLGRCAADVEQVPQGVNTRRMFD